MNFDRWMLGAALLFLMAYIAADQYWHRKIELINATAPAFTLPPCEAPKR